MARGGPPPLGLGVALKIKHIMKDSYQPQTWMKSLDKRPK
jgi:hypothetical protein